MSYRGHTYGGSGLQRQHGPRQNPVHVREQMRRTDSLFVPFQKLKPLLRKTKPGAATNMSIAWLSVPDLIARFGVVAIPDVDQDLFTGDVDWVYLGVGSEGVPLFAIDVSQCVRSRSI